MLRNIVGITTVNILNCRLEYIMTEKLGTRLNNHKNIKHVK